MADGAEPLHIQRVDQDGPTVGYQSGPNDLLRSARVARPSPSGSGRPMSRQELAEAVNAWLFEHAGRTFSVDAHYIGKLERGEHRWPSAHYRAALREVLRAAIDADLGFFIIQGHANDAEAAVSAGRVECTRPTLLRVLLLERHWQVYRTFRTQFVRAARDLAKHEDDPTVTRLDVSERQFQRWIHGARPRPDACRILEAMFCHSIARLLAPADADPASSPAMERIAGTEHDRAADVPSMPQLPDVPPSVQVKVSAGVAVTVVCHDGAPGRVAVLAGAVRVLIDGSGGDQASLSPALADAPTVAGGARVYSLADRRAR